MIKRFIVALFSALCFVLPASASIKIEADVLDSAIREHFSKDKDRSSALATYKSNIANDGSISASAIWKVCAAGGLDIKKTADKTKCQKFVNVLIRSGVFDYKHVCLGETPKDGGKQVCDESTFKSLDVTRDQAIGLIEEFVRIKHSDEVKCSNQHKYRIGNNDDYIACVSKESKVYYDFRFDDVKESTDNRIYKDTMRGICIIHDKEFKGVDSKEAFCKGTSKEECLNIKETAKKFGFTANLKSSDCKIDSLKKTSDTALRTQLIINGAVYEMDPYAFRQEEIQVNSLDTINDSICDYVADRILPNEYKSCECIKGFTEYKVKQAFIDEKDNIKTCTINGPKKEEQNQKIDFLFDDLSEFNDKKSKQGMSGISCTVTNGAWDGKDCVGLDETQCNDLAKVMKESCPDCKPVHFENGLCIAPDGHTQKNIETTGKVLVAVGGTALAVGLIVAPVPGSRGAAAVAFAYVAKVGATITILGTMTEGAGQIGEYVVYNKFKNRVAQCHDGECAKSILVDCWDEIQSLKNGLGAGEVKAINKMFENLINQVPDDDPFWLEFFDDSMFDENCNLINNDDTHWTKRLINAGQIMQAIGGVLQIVGATGMFFDKLRIIANNQGALGVWYRFTDVGPAKNVATRSQLLTSMGLKTGAPLNTQQMIQFGLDPKLLKGASVSRAGILTLADGTQRSALFVVHQIPLITKIAGVSSAAYATFRVANIAHNAAASRQPNGFTLPKCLSQTDVEVFIEDVGLEEEENHNVVPVPVVIPVPDVEPAPDVEPVPVVEPTPTVTNNRPTTFVPDKQKNTDLIAGLIAAGLVATGAVIGGVVAATTKNKGKETAATAAVENVDAQMEQVMHNANNVLGTIDGKQASLIPLPTTVNTNAKLVEIDKKAVAVVGYNGYKLPYFIKNGKWTPILGIGEVKHWFNVYPSASTGIKTLDKITGLMNQQLNPGVIMRYIGVNPSGLSLPVAATSAFGIINAEFPNGVLQSENMTAKEARLYASNYELIKNKLK